MLSVFLVILLSSAVFAEQEDNVDKILAALSGKFTDTAVPYYFSYINQYLKISNIKIILNLRNGRMSLSKLVRNGNVTFASTENEATFKFKATLETSVGYDYSIDTSYSSISYGNAKADWMSDMDMMVTASTEGCRLKITNTRNTQNFDMHFEPEDTSRIPVTVHYPGGDVVEKSMLPALDSALNKAFSGWTICDIFTC